VSREPAGRRRDDIGEDRVAVCAVKVEVDGFGCEVERFVDVEGGGGGESNRVGDAATEYQLRHHI
jgi:hypothetical protein